MPTGRAAWRDWRDATKTTTSAMITIFCCDRDDSVLEQYRQTLGGRGDVVRCFATITDLLTAFDEQTPALAIVESSDPVLQTLAACQTMHGAAPELPIVIALTQYNEFILKQSLRSGIGDYIIKPFSESELLAKTLVLLERAKQAGDESESLPDSAPARDSEVPLFADTYEILRPLGKGSYSTVYLAQDMQQEQYGRKVALKIFDSRKMNDPTGTRRSMFLREAYSMSRLNHPHIARLVDFGRTGTHYYLAMEYIQGQSLLDYIKQSGPIAEESLLAIAYDLTAALVYLDEHKVVHRDLKPNNILLTQDGAVKLVDFGLAKQQEDLSITDVHEAFRGTPAYASPEQIRQDTDIDIRTDVYSLGASLYFAASGRAPFAGKSSMEVVVASLETDPEPLHEVADGVSPGFSFLVHRMLAKNRDFRYRPADLMSDLMRLIDQY